MSPSKSFTRDRKFVLCTGQAVTLENLQQHPGAHIIGEIHYMPEEGVNVSALAVYERSRSVADVPASRPPIRVEIIGDARNIHCTCCHKRRRWEMSRTAISVLIARFGKIPVRTV